MSRSSVSKSHMFLIEFICVVMFFAICASLCISGFAKAETLSNKGLLLNRSVAGAETIAEEIKAMENPTEPQIAGIIEEKNGVEKEITYRCETERNNDILSAKIEAYNGESLLCRLEVKKYISNGGKDE